MQVFLICAYDSQDTISEWLVISWSCTVICYQACCETNTLYTVLNGPLCFVSSECEPNRICVQVEHRMSTSGCLTVMAGMSLFSLRPMFLLFICYSRDLNQTICTISSRESLIWTYSVHMLPLKSNNLAAISMCIAVTSNFFEAWLFDSAPGL